MKPATNRFKWKCKNGKTIDLPPMSEIDPDLGAAEALALASQDGNELVSMGMHVHFLSTALPPADGNKIRELKASEFEAFMEAWSTHSAVTVGELSAS